MPATSLILNILWIILGGAVAAFGWLVGAVFLACTIVGLLWVPAVLRIAFYTLLPFGHTVVSRAQLTGDAGIEAPLNLLGNIIWFVLAGWWIALGHVVLAILLAITIIGLPFAWAHLKLADAALWPVGKVVLPIDEARLVRRF